MSDTSQGPGWWLASDGKWYPPETAAAQPAQSTQPTQPAQPAPAQAAGTPQPGGFVPPPTKSSGKGCLIAVLVVLGLLVVAGIGVVVAARILFDDVTDRAFGGGPCPFLTDEDASEVLGEGTAAIETRGLSQVLVVIDARVMPEDPSCALMRDDPDAEGSTDSGGLGRVVRYVGADADAKYESELIKAKGVTEDRGGGVTVTSDEYFNTTVEGFADEAFCTKSSGLGAGVLVRDGDTLVYVSVVVDVGTTPGLDLDDPDNPKLGTDDLHCEVAQRIARVVL